MTTNDELILDRVEQRIQTISHFQASGHLVNARGLLTATVPARIGEVVRIVGRDTSLGEVIGFHHDQISLMPFSTQSEFQQGDRVEALGYTMKIPVGFGLLGRVINSTGQPLDGLGKLACSAFQSVQLQSPNALQRAPIDSVFETGQQAIDSLLTIGKGQRVGLFAGSGVGKSTLLGEIASGAASDVNVIAMIGERGREVMPFLKDVLGDEGLKRSVVIVSTADETALSRVRAAESAVAISHWFRQQNQSVFLMMDSLTRFAMAQRELGLMLGEPPTSRGYTPSVFSKLSALLEQLGNSDRGSITAILTVLVEGDDMNEPIADAVRSIVDGHIVLDRDLANAGHFPAIDVLQSASRLFLHLADKEHRENAVKLRRMLSIYREMIDLIQVGAYERGASLLNDTAIDMFPEIESFLQQELAQPVGYRDGVKALSGLANRIQIRLESMRAQEVGRGA